MENYLKKLKSIKRKLLVNQGSNIAGVFDSGIGGLTSLPTLLQNNFSTIHYLGDTANFPYGKKSQVELHSIILQRLNNLVELGAEKIYIACNTASINFHLLDKLQILSSYVVSIVDQASLHISRKNSKRIGLIGSNYTVLSNGYYHAIKKHALNPKITLIQSAEQDLINYIENNQTDKQLLEIRRITNYYNSLNIDTFILGCTHFGHIKDLIRSNLKGNIRIIDPSLLLGKTYKHTNKHITKVSTIFTGGTPKEYQKYITY